jgi:hypothetical protein
MYAVFTKAVYGSTDLIVAAVVALEGADYVIGQAAEEGGGAGRGSRRPVRRSVLRNLRLLRKALRRVF